ncbi:odorant receptor 98a-like [Drosophila busckii]|uniref:odorant receptor 98a-like n=1 Tax=Drosophila busckii TaxID=30019 RepID=UPI00083F38F8|nr:odorant receptor 98a-like [Drosophila busckii]
MFIAKYFEKAKPGAALLTSRDSYELAIFSMTLLGWHSPAGSGYATRAFAFIRISLNIMFSVIYLPIGFLLTYVRSISNMGAEELFTSMELFLNIPPCSLKILTMIWNRWRVYKAQELLDVLDERCVRSSERQLVHRLVNRSSKIFNAYHTLYVLVPVVMIVAGISSNRLPWMIYNPFIDYQSSTEKFLICCVIEFLIAGTAIYGNLIPDIIPVLFGFTVREHLQLLKGRVSRLCTDEEMTEQQNYEELVLCIKDHKMILAYCDHMRPLISLTMFIQFCAIAAALSVTMMHLVFFAHFWSGLGSALYMTGISGLHDG